MFALRSASCTAALATATTAHARGARTFGLYDERDIELFASASSGRLESCAAALTRGAWLQSTDERSRTPLHQAAAAGHTRVVEFLLAEGANPYHGAEDKWTPLHFAVFYKHAAAVKALLRFMSVVSGADSQGRTARDMAELYRYEDIVALFVEHEQRVAAAEAETDAKELVQPSNIVKEISEPEKLYPDADDGLLLASAASPLCH
eukprot:m.39565 g.39565  ORF g.39565 m.39565 type:complete len:206 (-) comp45608_c0_seq1:68-685(-)